MLFMIIIFSESNHATLYGPVIKNSIEGKTDFTGNYSNIIQYLIIL